MQFFDHLTRANVSTQLHRLDPEHSCKLSPVVPEKDEKRALRTPHKHSDRQSFQESLLSRNAFECTAR